MHICECCNNEYLFKVSSVELDTNMVPHIHTYIGMYLYIYISAGSSVECLSLYFHCSLPNVQLNNETGANEFQKKLCGK